MALEESVLDIEWDMIVVTVFLSILNQMEFNLVQNWKENCQKITPLHLRHDALQRIPLEEAILDEVGGAVSAVQEVRNHRRVFDGPDIVRGDAGARAEVGADPSKRNKFFYFSI